MRSGRRRLLEGCSGLDGLLDASNFQWSTFGWLGPVFEQQRELPETQALCYNSRFLLLQFSSPASDVSSALGSVSRGSQSHRA
jgi:hypothetical protein